MAPCNCRKGVAPLGSMGTTTTTTRAPGPWYSPSSLTASSGKFPLTVNGKTTVYGSELEYLAARKRAGY